MKDLMTVWLSISVVLIGLIALQGCQTAESKNEAAPVASIRSKKILKNI